MINEIELVKGCKAGKEKYQKTLFQVFGKRVMGICIRYSNCKAEADDMFQEAFCMVFSQIHKLKKDTPLFPWIRRVTINVAINYYHKHKKHHGHFDVIDLDEPDGYADEAIEKLSTDQILSVIDELPEGYKMVFNLYVIEGYAHKEIAKMLKITTSTSKSQLLKGRRLLMKKLKSLGFLKYEKQIG
ncbi:RNA polymerase sigma factor [Flexithrix dorotheae]|uniref:RNA polymerase sigma factor n=1 Tax=Flexithrix dorotheae TaxID=70993 RepID=UPI0003640C4F|nr:sigma-70 family RNA polymerase sigma factor [Flexithrix dorotheae]